MKSKPALPDMIRSLILALFGGVRISDAVEAVCYERQRPIGDRREHLSPGANAIWTKAHEVDRNARLSGTAMRPAPRMGF